MGQIIAAIKILSRWESFVLIGTMFYFSDDLFEWLSLLYSGLSAIVDILYTFQCIKNNVHHKNNNLLHQYDIVIIYAIGTT